jgi:hypothetical protein
MIASRQKAWVRSVVRAWFLVRGGLPFMLGHGRGPRSRTERWELLWTTTTTLRGVWRDCPGC